MNSVLDDLRPYLKGFLGTLAALVLVTLVALVYHLWYDHAALHQLIAALNALATRHPDLFK